MRPFFELADLALGRFTTHHQGRRYAKATAKALGFGMDLLS